MCDLRDTRSVSDGALGEKQEESQRNRKEHDTAIAFGSAMTSGHRKNRRDTQDYQRKTHQLLPSQLSLTALITGGRTIHICMHHTYLLLFDFPLCVYTGL